MCKESLLIETTVHVCEYVGVVMSVTHPEAFQSQTGALLDLSVSAFQTLSVVNNCLQKKRNTKTFHTVNIRH